MPELSPFDIGSVITLIKAENAEVGNQLQRMMSQNPSALSADVVTDLANQYLNSAEEGSNALDDTSEVGVMLQNLANTLRSVQTEAPVESDIETNQPNIMANKKFNLLKQSQSTNTNPMGSFFASPASLYQSLEKASYQEAIAILQETVTDQQFAEHEGNIHESLELIKEGVKLFYESDSEEEKWEAVQMVYTALPGSEKATTDEDPSLSSGDTIMAEPKKLEATDYTKIVEASNNEIKKIAQKSAKKKVAKSFNLIKTAQHGTDNNVIMWGPGQMRPDPFLRGQPVSDWHIYERNKGFGGDIDGYWGVDWEAVWRGNVMDKYSRPYRDAETGEWIGGYIEKRFEVDKNIPEGNNYQLKPGQLRRVKLPEHGVTEARLQHARTQEPERYHDSSKPFNWMTASSKKQKKQAQIMSDNPLDGSREQMNSMRENEADMIASSIDGEAYKDAYESGRWSEVYFMLDNARGQSFGQQGLMGGHEPVDSITGDDIYDRMLADQVYLKLSQENQDEDFSEEAAIEDMPVAASSVPKLKTARKKKLKS